ncbi:hypothetical protein MTO96_046588 [Rhipicephalus appendiculatus]
MPATWTADGSLAPTRAADAAGGQTNKGEWLRRLCRSLHRKVMSSVNNQADVTTHRQIGEVISAKKKRGGDAKAEMSPQEQPSA